MKYSMILLFALFNTFGYSQDSTTTKVDTTRISLGGTKIIIISNNESNKESNKERKEQTKETPEGVQIKKKKKHKNKKSMWSGIQIGTNMLKQKGSGRSQLELDQSKNRNYSLNLFSKRLDIGTPYIGFSTGLGLEFNKYALNNNSRLSYDENHVWEAPDTIYNFSKNFLRTTEITMPFLLEFNTKKNANDGFRFAAGIQLGYLVGARTKVKYENKGQRQIDKIEGNYNISAFSGRPLVMFGYKKVSLFTKISLRPFFKDKKGFDQSSSSNHSHTSFGLLFSFH